LGDIVASNVVLSPVGQMVESWWCMIGGRFPSVSIDEFVIMPNHMHGLLRFGLEYDDLRETRTGKPPCLPSPISTNLGPTPGRGKPPCLPSPISTNSTIDPIVGNDDEGSPPSLPLPHGDAETQNPASLGAVMQWFKSATTRDYGIGVDQYGWTPYPGRFWQRNYYERIVRDESELNTIRTYIIGNPGKWAEDEENRNTRPGFE